ncbi:MAG: YniB family protein [Pseudomonas sp.]|uniref:YniB family protein n=1 Tax=Pseudomonas sp. TaxID=306 RepID=UPI003D7003C8
MTVLEAIKKATRMKWSGLVVMLLGLTQLMMFSVLFIYDLGEQLKATPLSGLGYQLQNLCLVVYRHTSFLQPLWDVTPRVDVHQPLSPDMLMFIGIMIVIAAGAYIRGCGKQLSDDVAAIRKKARDELWLRSMLPKDPAATVINQPASVTVLTLQMPPGEVKNWWERPAGIILVGLATTYFGAFLTRVSGLT